MDRPHHPDHAPAVVLARITFFAHPRTAAVGHLGAGRHVGANTRATSVSRNLCIDVANRFPSRPRAASDWRGEDHVRVRGATQTRAAPSVPGGGRFVRPAWLQAFTEPRSTIKIMSVVCHSAQAGMAGHIATRERMKPHDYAHVVSSGDIGQHGI